MDFRPFNEDDWDGLAGCETKHPFICDSFFVSEDNKKWEGILVIDGRIIQAHLVRGNVKDITHELVLHREFATTSEAITFTMQSDNNWKMEDLKTSGFSEIISNRLTDW